MNTSGAGAPVRFTAVGDLLLGDSPISVGFGLHSRYPGAALGKILTHVAPILKTRDLVLGNLECPLTEHGIGASGWRRDQMRGDPEYAHVLRQAGVTALHVANNHSLQHGARGFDDTIAALEKHGIACVGLRGDAPWCARPVIVELPDKIRVGMLGYCWRPAQHAAEAAPFAEGTPAEAVADVTRLRAQCDAIVVSLHWGEDFVNQPSADEVAAAHALVDAGATVIVGHHPQVRRPIERYRTGIVAYSLGNFVADLLWLEAFRDGAMLHVDLGRTPLSPTANAIRLGDDFAPRPGEGIDLVEPVEGLAPARYREHADAALSRQRRRAYQYAVRHIRDYPVAVLADLAVTTVKNKLGFSTAPATGRVIE